MKTVFKIRDRSTGLFSTGGRCPHWTKSGKAWASEGALKSHLTMFQEGGWDYDNNCYRVVDVPASWEVVPFTFTEAEGTSFSAADLAARPAKK